jgi:hypothetical protein
MQEIPNTPITFMIMNQSNGFSILVIVFSARDTQGFDSHVLPPRLRNCQANEVWWFGPTS